MSSLKWIFVLLCAPFLLVASITAAEVDKEAQVETKKPSLTYYYFDG
ncbi:MAG: hypothetical protein ACI8T1_004186 [Verrucomicrobiales bacterium]|jgi:hypothetical protein